MNGNDPGYHYPINASEVVTHLIHTNVASPTQQSVAVHEFK